MDPEGLIVDVNQVVPNDNNGESNDSAVDIGTIIMNEALRFLPAKSLCRFKAVCKDWNVHISTPYFTKKQSETFRDISGFFFQPICRYRFVSLDPRAYGIPGRSLSKYLPEKVNVMASSNGLVCYRKNSGLHGNYYIYNPVTKQRKKLPPTNAYHGPGVVVVLIVEPYSNDNIPPHYTLICGFELNNFEGTFRFQRYNSAEGCWKDCGVANLRANDHLKYGVHVNGSIYYRTRKDDSTVLALDISTGRVKLVSANFGNEFGILGVMNGKLCETKIWGQGVIVSVFDADKEVWIEKHWTDFRFHFSGYRSKSLFFSPLKLLFQFENMILFVSDQYLCSYDMKIKEVCCLSGLGNYDPDILFRGRTFGYVNSFTGFA